MLCVVVQCLCTCVPLQAHSINVSRSESSITKIGRFLDGTLNKLLWGAGQEQGAGAGVYICVFCMLVHACTHAAVSVFIPCKFFQV